MKGEFKQFTMFSGDQCDVEGTYWSSGCGHAYVQNYTKLELFPVCPTCQNNIKWIFRTYQVPILNP